MFVQGVLKKGGENLGELDTLYHNQYIIITPVFITWRYLSWRAAGDCSMICEASLRAFDALISPSAAITWTQQQSQILLMKPLKKNYDPTFALASLLASASAAMALCNISGSLASFLKKEKIIRKINFIPSKHVIFYDIWKRIRK